MKVLVTGGRGWGELSALKPWPTKYEVERKQWEVRFVFESLTQIDKDMTITDLAHGGATGADSVAGQWASQQGHINIHVYEADWHAPCTDLCYHRPKKRLGQSYCPVAGLRRNERMLTEFKPELVVAFPGGTGTEHMVKIAQRAGVEVAYRDC